MDPLLRAWTSAVGDGPRAEAAGRELLARYAEPHRRYHDRRHLAEVLAALDVLTAGAPPVPVVCAAYAHDAVHDGAPDDERRSAELAVRVLGGLSLHPTVVDEVVRLVLLTVTHEVDHADTAGALLCDADLAVLASPAERYGEYVRDVRAEYAHVDDATFRSGRSAVLRALLAHPRLYATEAGHRRWETAARRNLQDEISSSDGASDGAAPPPAVG